VLFKCLVLCYLNRLVSLVFRTTIYLEFLLSPLPPACLAHVIILGFSVLIISDESSHCIEAPSYVIVSPVVQILLLASC
jgi:hypothetical protein